MFLRSTYLCIRIQFIYEIFAQKHSPVSFIWFCMVINTSLWYSICYYFFSTFTYEPQGKIRVLFGSEDQSPFCRRGHTLPWRCWRFSVWTGKLGLCVQMAGCWPSPSNQQQVGCGAESEAGLWLPVVPLPCLPFLGARAPPWYFVCGFRRLLWLRFTCCIGAVQIIWPRLQNEVE